MSDPRDRQYAVPLTAAEVVALRNVLSHLLSAAEQRDVVDPHEDYPHDYLDVLGEVLVKLLTTWSVIRSDPKGGG